MRVCDLMTRDVISVRRHTRITDIARLLTLHRLSAVPVLDDERHVIGIVTQHDLFPAERLFFYSQARVAVLFDALIDHPPCLPHVYREHTSCTASDVMSKNVLCVNADDELGAAVTLMLRHRIKQVPVIRADGTLAGIITRSNLIQLLAEAA